jgi:UDP-glucose 4-epimerase
VRALVTGGAGFIGSNLADALLDRGDEVTVLDDLSTGRRPNLAPAERRGATVAVGDVANSEAVAGLVSSFEPESVFHLAAQIDVRRSVAEPAFDATVNVLGTINVLEAVNAQANPARVVLASTGGAIYGEGSGRDLPLAEDAECLPEAAYGQSKFAAEGYLSLYGRLHGVPGTALRLANIYGPRQDPLGEAGVVAIFCGRLLRGDQPIVFGTGEQTRDYLYVGDVVGAMIAADDRLRDSGGGYLGTFNIGTGRETTVLELARLLAEIGETPGVEPVMEAARPGEVERIALDSSLARERLGWEPTTDLQAGLEQTFAAVASVGSAA